MHLWLPLTEYSTKYKVSVSTLRRRIKAEDIQYRFEDGKYLLSDEPPVANQRNNRPSLGIEDVSLTHHQLQMPRTEIEARLQQRADLKDEPVLLAANKLLNELKKAYTQILQEKEEQILHLKEEVSDLKTLVRVLEGENNRLKQVY